MTQIQPINKDSLPWLGEAISSNFGAFVEELSGVAGFPISRNSSLCWYTHHAPHPMFGYAYARGEIFEQDLVECLNDFKQAKSPFFFCASHPDQASRHAAVFSQFGVTSLGLMDGMCFDLKDEMPLTSLAVECSVERVQSLDSYKAFAEVMAEAAGLEKVVGPQFWSSYARLEASSFLAFIAYVGECPVGCSLLFMPEGQVAGNYFDWVLPEFRKQGIDSAMVVERLRVAKGAGYGYLIAQCMDTSTRLYSRLGFQSLSNLALYLQQ